MKPFTLALLLLTACGSSTLPGDGDSGTDACTATPPSCCQGGCNGDVPATPVCQEDTWVCPEGSVSAADCSPERFCQGPSVDAGNP